MKFIEQLVLNHILASHGVTLVLAALLARADHLILFALKIFTEDQIDAAIDKAAAAAKARVDADVARPKN